MVRTLVDGLPAHGFAVHHVNLGLSRDHADIGRWRPGKGFALLAACIRTVVARFRRSLDTLYYVPAPGKRGALWRDCCVMLLCRPFFRNLVLHFHSGGLTDWLATRATGPERWLTRLCLGRAQLAMVLTPALRADAVRLNARRIAVVPNGIDDPCPGFSGRPSHPAAAVFEILFLGLCAAEKGLFDAAAAVLAVNQKAGKTRCRLTAAGTFPDSQAEARFQALCAKHPGAVRHAGFVTGDAKQLLLDTADCLCLPTRYAHEAQPLVLLEAMACDLPVVTTFWRGIPETVPPGLATVIPPSNLAALTAALENLPAALPPSGSLRRHFLEHGTRGHHLQLLAAALRTIDGNTT
jgi:glycosyltransferase involved in cell wall biosynthesis